MTTLHSLPKYTTTSAQSPYEIANTTTATTTTTTTIPAPIAATATTHK